MDTRSKIVEPAAIPTSRPVTLVAAWFDLLTAEDIADLEEARRHSDVVVAVVLALADELLPQHARAELAAALRMIDYVVATDGEGLNDLIVDLPVVEVVYLQVAGASRRRELIEHVRRKQIR